MLADLIAAWRALRRSPVFAATVVATFAIGIGSSAAMFSIVYAALLRPLPYREPDRLVRIWESNPAAGHERSLVSAANVRDWRERSSTFQDLALFGFASEPTVLGVGDLSVQARQTEVTPNFFVLLGITVATGRQFTAARALRQPLDPTEIIISHAFWQRAFGADPAVVGRSVRIEGIPGSAIVGVMPAGFAFPEGTDFWTPLDLTRAAASPRDVRMYGGIARLSPGATLLAARAELQSIAASLARDNPSTNASWTVAIEPLHESVVQNHRLALMVLFAATAFVLLVGCANVANLLLARGIARRTELAVRTALGASRGRIVRLLLSEALLVALIGGIAGCVLAWALLPGLIRLAGENVPRLTDARVSAATLLYAFGAAIVAAVIAALIPALRVSHMEASGTLRPEGERATQVSADARLPRTIVAGELAICLVLLVGAMLFVRTLVRLNALDLGFDPAQVISIETRIPIYRTRERNSWQLLAADTSAALQRLRAIPGVQAASATSDIPLSGNLLAAEISVAGDARPREAFYHRVSPDYFRTLGMTLISGRDFTDQDVSDLARLPDPRAAVPREGAAIVNETTARAFWRSGDALGQYLSTSFDARAISRRRVVGIVRDARSATLRGSPPAEVYVPYLEDPSFAMTILIRTALPADRIVPIVRRELRDVSADMSTANIRMLDAVVGESLRSPRFNAFVIAAFSAATLFLAALGVFGVFAFSVAARIREIGIRMVLGATVRDLTRMFLRRAVGPIAAGVLAGTAAALTLSRLVRTLLFGVEGTDATSYGAAAAILVAVAFAASYLPVRRIVRIEPARALRG